MEYIPAVAGASAARTPSDSRNVSSSSSANSSPHNVASARPDSFHDLVRRVPDPRGTEPNDVASIDEAVRDASENLNQDTPSTLGSSGSSSNVPIADIETDEAYENLKDAEQIFDPSVIEPSQLPPELSLSLADASSTGPLDISSDAENFTTSPIEQSPDLESTPAAQFETPAAQPAVATYSPAKSSDSQLSATSAEVASAGSEVEITESVEIAEGKTEGATVEKEAPAVDESEIVNTEQSGEVAGQFKSVDATAALPGSDDASQSGAPSNTAQAEETIDPSSSKQADTRGSATAANVTGARSISQPSSERASDAATFLQQRLQPIAAATEFEATAPPVIAASVLAAAEVQAINEDADNNSAKIAPLEAQDADEHAVLEPTLLTEDGERQLLGQSSRRTDSTVPASVEMSTADRVRLVQRIAGAFQTSLDRGGEVSLRLHPPELGRLNVEVQMREGKLSARMEAESTSVQQLLLDSLPQLRERLAEHQIKIEQFQVDVMNQHNSHFSHTPHDRPDRQRSAEALLPLSISDTNKGSQQTSRQDQLPRLSGAPWVLDRLNVLV